MNRCAACRSRRIKCHSDCVFSPYFPSTDPERFASVHKIYTAGHVSRMLQQLPVHLRAEAADALYYEAKCRIRDPVYGCVGVISQLHQQICDAQKQLAKAQAEVAFFNAHNALGEAAATQLQLPIEDTPCILPQQNSIHQLP
ncbi:hypothetical protein RJ639_027954 [Escallonia herrerae]|uniref:LOB domain-containing protein n=1 Tax=Escallonia herrerae TaxID=1293975 RepID=A0AA88XBL3_9ASTE|nr:hypothetical protein RJ639_027954 [Escallonia herrerae]